MKTIIDLDGVEIEVADDTPVKTVDGKHYLLTDDDKAEIAAREKAHQDKAPERVLQEIKAKRRAEYGTAEKQIEFITENGLDAWKKKVAKIKAKYPKE